MNRSCILFLTVFTILSAFSQPADSAVREYRLTIAEEQLHIGGRKAVGMTINGSIPGPTLYFDKGDPARIHVKNEMPVPSSIHWHGVLVAPGMDEVPLISQVPIQPGETFTYEFLIRQTGVRRSGFGLLTVPQQPTFILTMPGAL